MLFAASLFAQSVNEMAINRREILKQIFRSKELKKDSIEEGFDMMDNLGLET